MGTIKLLARTQWLRSSEPTTATLDACKEMGFDGVELVLQDRNWTPYSMDSATMQDLASYAKSIGLSPMSSSLHGDYIFDNARLEATLHAIELAQYTDTKVLIISGAPKRQSDESEWQHLVAQTRTLVDLATEKGVVLALEFEPEFVVGTTEELVRLFSEIPSDYLCANLDLGHAFLCDPDPHATIRNLREKIVHCHIEDMRAGIHNHRIPGEGDMDLGAIVATLAETGYNGPLALDLYCDDYEGASAKAVPFLRKLLP